MLFSMKLMVGIFISPFFLLPFAAAAQTEGQTKTDVAVAGYETDRRLVNKAPNKAILGTALFGAGELLTWMIIYPKTKKLRDKLLDDYDEETGETVTLKERSREVAGESMGLMTLGLPIRAVRITGSTIACLQAVRSTRSARKILKDESRSSNSVLLPYVGGWVIAGVGKLVSFVINMSQDRESLRQSMAVTQIAFVGQSVLWGISGILAIPKCASNKKAVEGKTALTITPLLFAEHVGLAMEYRF
jgi:hypothetical protein